MTTKTSTTTTNEITPHTQAVLNRCDGNAFLMYNWAQKCTDELAWYRANLSHRTALENWTHAQWRDVAVALLRETANSIEAGGLEPPVDVRVKSMLDDIEKQLAQARLMTDERNGAAARAAYGMRS